MNKKITTLFLDIGGVMLTNGWGRDSRKRAADKFALDPKEMQERHHLTFDTYEEGKITLDQYLDRLVFYEPRSFGKEDFKQFMLNESQPFPEMIDLICSIKSKYNLKAAIVNNEGRELNTYRIKTYGINKFIDFFISSSFVHFRKPDPDIFKIALDIALVEPEEVVYIDDRAMFVSVAKDLGINGIVHTEYASTKKQLEQYELVL